MTKDQRPKTKSQFEHSAGGVIYRKLDKNIEILLLKDKNGEWSFPKGLIEENEELIDTAKREISEEVGLNNLIFIETLDSIGYFYRFDGNLIRKKVDFFLFRYDGNEEPIPLEEEGISEVRWFDLDQALANIGYVKTNKPVLEKALDLIRNS